MKTCVCCGYVGDIFGSDKSQPDALKKLCRKCSLLKPRTRYLRYSYGSFTRAKLSRERSKNYPKEMARRAVKRALRDGVLVKSLCHICGSPVTQAHHEDYTKPLDIIWLCPQHHAQRHSGIDLPLSTWITQASFLEGDVRYVQNKAPRASTG